jgi:hypothetical protein
MTVTSTTTPTDRRVPAALAKIWGELLTLQPATVPTDVSFPRRIATPCLPYGCRLSPPRRASRTVRRASAHHPHRSVRPGRSSANGREPLNRAFTFASGARSGLVIGWQEVPTELYAKGAAR